MKSLPQFTPPTTTTTAENVDLDVQPHDKLEEIEKAMERKLAKKTSEINNMIDKDIDLNTIYVSAIDIALSQTADYFISVKSEENEKERARQAQFVIQKPPKVVVPSEKATNEIKYSLKLGREGQAREMKRIKEETEKMEELKKKLGKI
ncbi:hypothetical protein TRFO_33568 [Tritrichomonas foetus]|uniref:Uncharacterized protein n=1 Tax=Tritrichomonas foetus TaxID=1144522 RepID=A0A1J4JRQ0_9EUKA|nr:hypothetical protein TRFO_33568 [Tritrichomonas foetus]|eukprot:OHS99924.1 hypothetical protein TRFO_33568 [Tritrichomonas foetus]